MVGETEAVCGEGEKGRLRLSGEMFDDKEAEGIGQDGGHKNNGWNGC